MHDLDPIVIAKLSGAPPIATHDNAIQFDGDSGGRQVKLGDEISEGKRTGELSGFAVYVNAQRQASSGGGMNDAAKFGCLVLHHGTHQNGRAAGRKLRNLS